MSAYSGAGGGDVLLTLHPPLPLRVVAELCAAVHHVATTRLGYTDVVLLTDGTNRVVARRATDTGRADQPEVGSSPGP